MLKRDIKVSKEPADALPANQIDAMAKELLATKPGAIRAKLIRMDTITRRPVTWLWQYRFAAGRLSTIVGNPGGGKSFMTCDMAARVSTGTPWPDGSPCKKGSVILITAEDDPEDTIGPRLDACGADSKKIYLLNDLLIRRESGEDDEVMFTLADCPILEDVARSIDDLALIIIDPVGSFIGGKTDAHRDNEVRGKLTPLSKIAERTGAAIVTVMHTKKGSGFSADDMALGSRAFTGLARSVWHLMRDPDDHDRRLFLAGKNNLAAACDGLAFTLSGSPARVEWEDDAVVMSADEGVAATNAANQQSNSAKATSSAEDWLRERLSRGDEEGNSVKSDAARAGHKERTIQRAALKLKVRHYRPKTPGPEWWSIKPITPIRHDNPDTPANSLGVSQIFGVCDPNAGEGSLAGDWRQSDFSSHNGAGF